MTSCWSKSKTGKKYPYYMCFSKGWVSYRESIRRDVIEGEFDDLLHTLTPSNTMVDLFRSIFSKSWNMQAKEMDAVKAAAKRKIAGNEKQIGQLLERIITASNPSVITAYENRIEKLERERLVLTEKVQNIGKPKHTFSEMFELGLGFLSNPQKLWESEQLVERKTLLRLLFSGPLEYHRNQGFRTPQTSSIFAALQDFSTAKTEMADTESA